MICNGSGDAITKVWCQNVNVTQGVEYSFSFWAHNLVSPAAVLDVTVNNTPINFNLASTIDQWGESTTTWTSVTTASVEVCIINETIAAGGNDFGLDDISMDIVQYDSVEVTVLPNLKETRNIELCEQEPNSGNTQLSLNDLETELQNFDWYLDTELTNQVNFSLNVNNSTFLYAQSKNICDKIELQFDLLNKPNIVSEDDFRICLRDTFYADNIIVSSSNTNFREP